MRTYDLTPLLRSTIGFDHINRLFEGAARFDGGARAYPPYNIEKTGEDRYRITMALAGFTEDDIDVTAKETTLIVSGKALSDRGGVTYLHRGIAGRAFERRFELAETVKVAGANLEHGLLHIELVRETPEALKPRKIAITAKAA